MSDQPETNTASNFTEIVVFIHGVTHEGGSHGPQYSEMDAGIRGNRSDWPGERIDVEWGWAHGGASNRSEQRLAKAQELLGGRIAQTMDAHSEFTLNPLRVAINKVRPILIYRFADMFYYVSRDGKEAVRQTVAEQIIEGIEQRVDLNGQDPVSLTFVAHSAGSVIAFDLLFHLFHRNLKHEYLQKPAESANAQVLKTKLDDLRDMAQNGRLRVRRLFTFGSPVAWTAVRKDEVVDILAADGRLDPGQYGLVDAGEIATGEVNTGEPLNGPRWVNLWDKDDFAATPVEPLMDNALGVIEDINVNVSWSITDAHDAYWASEKAHRLLADRW